MYSHGQLTLAAGIGGVGNSGDRQAKRRRGLRRREDVTVVVIMCIGVGASSRCVPASLGKSVASF